MDEEAGVCGTLVPSEQIEEEEFRMSVECKCPAGGVDEVLINGKESIAL